MTQLTYEEIKLFPGELIADLMASAYKQGMKDHVLGLATLLKDKKGYGFSYKVEELFKKIVADNEQELFEKLSSCFQKETNSEIGINKILGGVCLSVVKDNVEMLERLKKNGAKPDRISTNDIKKHCELPKKNYGNYYYHSREKRAQNTEYDGMSAFWVAAVFGRVEFLDKLQAYWPEDCHMRRKESIQEKGPRGGYRGYATVIKEDIVCDALSYGQRSTIEWLFKNRKEETFNTFKNEANLFILGMELIPEKEKQELWLELKAPIGYRGVSAITNLIATTPSLFVSLAKKDGERAVELIEEGLILNEETKVGLIESADYTVVKKLIEKNPGLLTKVWEDTPADTRHTKRNIGILLKTLFYNKAEVVYELSKDHPELLEQERGMIKEYLSREWIKSHRNQNMIDSDFRDPKVKQEEVLRVTTIWEKMQLLQQVDSTIKEKKGRMAL